MKFSRSVKSVGPCGLVCTMGRKPERNRTWATNFGRNAVAEETSVDSEECDVPSESVEPTWLESYQARLDGMRAKEMARNEYRFQQHVHWRQPGGFANRVYDLGDDGNSVEVVWDSLTCMWVPCPAQWSEHAKAEGIALRNKQGDWCLMGRYSREQMPMPDGMPDGSFDSNQHGEATTPDCAPRVRVKRTDSRSGSRRRQDVDRTKEYAKRTKKRRDEKEAILRGMYDEEEHGLFLGWQ